MYVEGESRLSLKITTTLEVISLFAGVGNFEGHDDYRISRML